MNLYSFKHIFSYMWSNVESFYGHIAFLKLHGHPMVLQKLGALFFQKKYGTI